MWTSYYLHWHLTLLELLPLLWCECAAKVHSTRMHRWKTAIPSDTEVPETLPLFLEKYMCVNKDFHLQKKKPSNLLWSCSTNTLWKNVLNDSIIFMKTCMYVLYCKQCCSALLVYTCTVNTHPCDILLLIQGHSMVLCTSTEHFVKFVWYKSRTSEIVPLFHVCIH